MSAEGGGGSTMRDGVGEGSVLGVTADDGVTEADGASEGEGDADTVDGVFEVQPAVNSSSVEIRMVIISIDVLFFIVYPRLLYE